MLKAVEDFSVVADTWERRAKAGSLKRTYEVTVAAEFAPGEPKFAPELRSSMHSTALTPDGRYVYISGAAPSGEPEPQGAPPGLSRSASSLLKVDALTLQPVRQLSVGGRMHHAQVFQDRYMLIDTFAQDPDGLTAYLFDPDTWEVLQEYPHPGHRADWICLDQDAGHMYVPSTGSHTVSRIDIESGEIAWTRPTGPGPYGCAVNADSSEVWIADKGEATGLVGRAHGNRL